MTTYSQHPEVEVAPALREAVERVRSGIERVVILADIHGEPLAAIVSLAAVRLLDEGDVALQSDAALAQSDTAGLRLR